MVQENKLKKIDIKRSNKEPTKPEQPEPAPVSAGPVDKLIDYVMNPTRDKIREVTVIDRWQARLLPQLDMIIAARSYVLEVAEYRQDSSAYADKYDKPRPVMPNLLDELVYRTAQWNKSVQGKNLDRAMDIALADIETKGNDDDFGKTGDPWAE